MQYFIAGLGLIFSLMVLLQWHVVCKELLILSALLTAFANPKIKAQIQTRSLLCQKVEHCYPAGRTND